MKETDRICHFKYLHPAKKIAFLFILTILSFPVSRAQENNVTIKGTAKEYAGLSLSLQHIFNYISHQSEKTGDFTVDPNGNFSFSTHINRITHAFIDLGIARGFIYLEPGKKYELILPPYIPKKGRDKFNPYFIPREISLGIKNKDAQKLNKEIAGFDEEYNYEFNKNAVEIFNRNNVERTKQITARLDSMFPAKENSFFSNYKHFRYAKLFMLSMKRQKSRVIHDFYSLYPVGYENPAYWETFNLMFRNFMASYFSSRNGYDMRTAYGRGAPFDSLSLILARDTLYQKDEFREVVLLKGMYDAFYSGRYDKNRLIVLFDQASKSGSTEFIRQTALSLHKKVTHLRKGTKAPDFTLLSVNGKKKSLSSYRGKFVYLNFCSTDNHNCKKDFQLLDAMSKGMKRDLTIVSVSVDTDPEKTTEFVKTNKYKWDFLLAGDSVHVIRNYSIKTLPTYFLIDPDGKLLLSPAPSPEENFGAVFYDALKKYKYNQLRKEPPAKKSIYDL